jgi:putative membrane protein
MMGYWGYGWGPGMHIWGGLIPLVVWLVVIVAIVSILRRGFRGRWDDWKDTKALDILKERYAKGEIDKEEFLEKKKDLES